VLVFGAGLMLVSLRDRSRADAPPQTLIREAPALGRGDRPFDDGAAGRRPLILLAALAAIGALNAREARRQRRSAAAAAASGKPAVPADRDPASARLLARTCLPAAMAAIVVSELVPAAGFGGRAGRAALVAGLAVTAAGAGLRQQAIGTLGRFFTSSVTIQPGHRLIQGGPYRRVRHPGYAGIWLQVTGIGLASGNPAGLAICLLLPPLGIVARIRAEEAMLAEAFPGEFPGYAAGTRRLVPFAW
jgi:protein-S-isoprenylcysteine O-methyltransferase